MEGMNKIKIGYTNCKVSRTHNLVRYPRAGIMQKVWSNWPSNQRLSGNPLLCPLHQEGGTEGDKFKPLQAGTLLTHPGSIGPKSGPDIDLGALIQSWMYSTKGTAAIWATGHNGVSRQEDGDKVGEDFVSVRIKNISFISIYLSPNTTEDAYALKIERILEFVKQEKSKGRSIIIGGDFNARSPAWGSEEQNSKGTILLDALLSCEIAPLRPRGGSTSERGRSVSYLDFLAATPDLVRNDGLLSRVLNTETASDHKCILSELKLSGKNRIDTNSNTYRWKMTPHGLTKLKVALDKSLAEGNINEGNQWSTEQEEKFLPIIKKSCEESLEKIGQGKGSRTRNNPWWNQEIKEERAKVQKLRRKIQRTRKRKRDEEREFLTYLYKKGKKKLQIMISKDVRTRARRRKISQPWKEARTILLRKEGKDPAEPSAYRPICIIDAMAKLLECILKKRFLQELGEESFDQNQYGFTKGKSTLQPMEKIREAANETSRKQRYAGMIALDIRNAFNTLSWEAIITEMKRRNLPEYLVSITNNYFRGRTAIYQTEEVPVKIDMQMGVPQNSVLGPFLWNLVYDGLLTRPLPPMSMRLAFADDVVIIAQAATIQRLKLRAKFLIEDSKNWMQSAGLTLAGNKTELIMLNRKNVGENFSLKIGDTEVKPNSHVKYLGVIFDDKRSFKKHIETATNKAIRTLAALSSLMTNAMKTRQNTRKLYYMTTESIVLYGAPIWAEAIENNSN
ncbi:uncharacterized protein LOC143363394 [Halictus rubicundus]|uniref:uncharacterized protein LOC143363394 n=1 Tax=Halictus rubicundus TaxID=77578 RepID=UPI004036DC19